MEDTYIVKNKDKFILKSTPIDWKLGRWYRAATKIQAMYLQKKMFKNHLVPTGSFKCYLPH